MTMTRRFFTMLAIFFCTRLLIVTHGASIVQSAGLTAAVESFKHEAEVAGEEIAMFPTIGVSKGSLASTRVVIPLARTIPSRSARIERKKRHVTLDDDKPTSKNGKTFRLGDHVTRKHGKHRRRNRCKKGIDCSRLGHRRKKLGKNGNIKRKDIGEHRTTVEPRKWFEHQPRGNSNSEGRVLVGNRPLALFRKELAAAAAVNVTQSTATSRTTTTIRPLIGMGSKKIDLSTVTKTRRIKTSSRLHLPKVSTKNMKIINGTLGERVDEASTRKKTRHFEENGHAATTFIPEDSSKRNAETQVHESRITLDEQHPAMTIVVKRVPRTKSINAK